MLKKTLAIIILIGVFYTLGWLLYIIIGVGLWFLYRLVYAFFMEGKDRNWW